MTPGGTSRRAGAPWPRALAAGAAGLALAFAAAAAARAELDFAPAGPGDLPAQKRTVYHLRGIGTAIESYLVDNGYVPRVPPGVVSDLAPWLVPFYSKELPGTDGWGSPILWEADPRADSYSLISLGRDGAADAVVEPGPTTRFEQDIYFSNGQLTVYPEYRQEVMPAGGRGRGTGLGDLAAQKQTMVDLRRVGTAVESYVVDNAYVPRVPPGVVSDLAPWLTPVFIRQLPGEDGWGSRFLWDADPSSDSYSVISLGRDGAADGAVTAGPTTAFDHDIYFSDGKFTVYPEGPQR